MLFSLEFDIGENGSVHLQVSKSFGFRVLTFISINSLVSGLVLFLLWLGLGWEVSNIVFLRCDLTVSGGERHHGTRIHFVLDSIY